MTTERNTSLSSFTSEEQTATFLEFQMNYGINQMMDILDV